MHAKSLTCAAILLCLSACSSGPVQTDSGDVIQHDVIEDPGPSDLSEDTNRPDVPPEIVNPNLLGTFRVEERTSIYPESTGVGVSAFGFFLDSPMPPYLTLEAWEGDCALYLYNPNRCGGSETGGCTLDKVCAADGTCVSWPEHASVGPMTLSGLTGIADQTIQNDSYAYYLAQFPYPPPADIFDSSSEISISAPGDALGAVSLTVKGVDALVVDDTTYKNVVLASDDAAFHWTAGKAADRVRLRIPAVNECHGCPPLGEIICDAADTGTLVVPGTLLAGMPKVMDGICVGIDCPQATLERYHSKVAHLPQGDVELRVASTVGFGVEHAEQPPPDAGFLISITEARSARSSPYAFVSVSNPPATEMPLIVQAEVNGCKFMEPEEPGQCEELCSWPGYCGSDNACHEGTPRRFAGDIALTGLDADCSLPVKSYNGQNPYYMGVCDPAEPTSLFDKGTSVTATAAGSDDLPAFSLQAPGVADIVTTLPCDGFELESGKYLQVLWEPSDQTGDRIQFYLRSANHGNQFGHIVCDSPDNGVLVVESNLIDLHLAAFNPAPSWGLIRVHTEVKEVDGMRVALETRSQISCMY